MKLRQLATIALAVLLLPFCGRLRRRKFVLVGGHEGALFADNSKILYQYLLTQQADYEVFWIVNADSPDRTSISTPINRGSLRNYLYFLTSDGVFFSHTGSDVAPILHNFWRGPVRFFIEHGIVGLKRAKLAPDSRSSHLGPDADLWVCSSAFEKNIKVREWGLPEDRVKITGLARYDLLLPRSRYRKEILYMPTWREWLADCTEAQFRETEFYRDLLGVVGNLRLRAQLAAEGYHMVIYLHFYFHKFIKAFDMLDDPLIEFLPAEVDIQDYIINSAIMITDYSSVAWDFFYLDKPVLFFQPDLENYLELRGSYVDMRSGLFGPQSADAEELTAQIEEAIHRGAELVARYRGDKELYFAFHDTDNCRRTFLEFQRFRGAGS